MYHAVYNCPGHTIVTIVTAVTFVTIITAVTSFTFVTREAVYSPTLMSARDDNLFCGCL